MQLHKSLCSTRRKSNFLDVQECNDRRWGMHTSSSSIKLLLMERKAYKTKAYMLNVGQLTIPDAQSSKDCKYNLQYDLIERIIRE